MRGEVIPVTLSDTRLYMELSNGKLLSGEHEINTNTTFEKVGVKKVFLKPKPKANPLAVKRILEADLVVIGPGSHYCGIIPNFLVPGIALALRKSKAKVVYNCNLVSKQGQTDHFTLEDYVTDINRLIGKERIDFVTFNTARPPKQLLKKYAEEGSTVPFLQKDQPRSYRVIQADLLSFERLVRKREDKIASTRSFIRHDSKKLGKVLMFLLEIGDYESILKDIV